jgi:Kelch motif protein
VKYKKVLSLIGIIGLSLVSTGAFAQPAINAGPTMNDARYDGAWAKLPSGNLLIAGGGGLGGFLDTVEIYRYRTDDFVTATLPTMSMARANETATALPNGKILIAGGAVTSSPPPGTWTDSTDLFDPATRTITAGPTMNNQREGATAQLVNGWVIIAGGRDSSGTLNTVDIYHPVKNTITAGPPMNVARYDCASVVLPNGNLMIFGGFGAVVQSGPLQSTEIYNVSLHKWASAPPSMLDKRGGARATLLANGKVLITGGTNGTNVLDTTEIYDPSTRTFTPGPTMNSPRKYQAQVRLANGQVLIAGGYTDDGGTNVTITTDIYHPFSNKITVGPDLSDGRALAAASRFANGHVLIAGGSNGSTIVDTTDVYTP